MTKLLDSALVLCDLDHLLLAGDGNMPQVVRDVLQLFSSRGGRLTVFTQRSPRAVRAVLGGVRLAAPALTCGGTLAYRFSEGSGQPLCSFAGCEESIFKKLPAAVGLGIALQMADGSTRVLRMSTALERHLRREFTPFTLCSPADVRGEDVLRILLYQDRQQLPIQALLERALGDNAAMLRSERIGMDVMVLTPGTVSAEAMRPDAGACPSGQAERRPGRCPGGAAPCRQSDDPDRPRHRRGGRVFLWPCAKC